MTVAAGLAVAGASSRGTVAGATLLAAHIDTALTRRALVFRRFRGWDATAAHGVALFRVLEF